MGVEEVEPESTAAETRCPKSLSSAECYCRIIDSDLVADDWSRWKFTVTIQHARGVQEQQYKAKIEKIPRRFYPPSLAWFHLFDTQLLLKCQSESFPMACELRVSGLRFLNTEYPRNPKPTALSSKRSRDSLWELLQLSASGYL